MATWRSPGETGTLHEGTEGVAEMCTVPWWLCE